MIATASDDEDTQTLNDWAKREGVVGLASGFVTLPGGSTRISDTARELFGLIAPTEQMFTRGGVVVTLQTTTNGVTILQPLQPSAARSVFEKSAAFAAWRILRGEAVLKPSIMPEDTARALLNCYLAKELLPPITGLVNCPILAERNGRLEAIGKGYDSQTGLYVLRGDKPPQVPLSEAVESLRSLLSDFDFESAADESRAMSALLSPALRMGGLITSYIPADVAEADQSQSGKTYRHRTVAAIYAETPALVPLKRGGVGSTDEAFFERLVSGRPFIQFDNYRGPLDSPALEAFLTAGEEYNCRVPHHGSIPVQPSRFFIQLSSNGFEGTRDFANRACIIRIRKRQGVEFPDTLAHVRKNQSYYLGCAFAVLQEWFRQGKPRTKEMRHDFREWCGTNDWINQNLFGMAPLMDGHYEAQMRLSNPTLTFLRQIAIEIERQCRLEELMTASQLCEVARAGGISIPGMRQENAGDDDRAMKTLGAKLAVIFKTDALVEVEGFTISKSETQQARTNGSGGSFPSKSYSFSRSRSNPQQPF